MTFMNEIDGEAYRVQITNVYTSRENNNEPNPNNDRSLLSRSKSLMKFIETKEQEEREKEKEDKNLPRVNSKLFLNDYLPQYDLSASMIIIIMFIQEYSLSQEKHPKKQIYLQ